MINSRFKLWRSTMPLPLNVDENSESFKRSEPMNSARELPVDSSDSPWLNSLSDFISWLSEKFDRVLYYLYPDSWKTIEAYTPDELLIIQEQERTKQISLELQTALLERKTEKVDLNKVNKDLCSTLECSTSDSITVSASPNFESELQQIQREFENCVNDVKENEPFVQSMVQPEPIRLEIGSGERIVEISSEKPIPSPLVSPITQPASKFDWTHLTEEKLTFFERLFHILDIPLRIVKGQMRIGTNNIQGGIKRLVLVRLIEILIRCLVLFCYWKIATVLYTIITSFVDSALRSLPNKTPTSPPIETSTSKLKTTSKKRKSKSNKELEDEESKEFWEKNLGWVSQVIKIPRGGSLVPLQEVNIYEFSDFDRQQILQFIAPENYLIKLERYRLELKTLLFNSPLTLIQRRFSRLELKQLLRFRSPILSDQVKASLLGVAIFLSASCGTPIPTRSRNLLSSETSVPTEQLMTSTEPLFKTPIDRRNFKEGIQMNPLPTETKEPLKNTESIASRLKSVKKVRKTAKITRLADLPSVTDKDSDFETYSASSPKIIQVKVR